MQLSDMMVANVSTCAERANDQTRGQRDQKQRKKANKGKGEGGQQTRSRLGGGGSEEPKSLYPIVGDRIHEPRSAPKGGLALSLGAIHSVAKFARPMLDSAWQPLYASRLDRGPPGPAINQIAHSVLCVVAAYVLRFVGLFLALLLVHVLALLRRVASGVPNSNSGFELLVRVPKSREEGLKPLWTGSRSPKVTAMHNHTAKARKQLS